jgi:hypothetical protein
MFSFKHKNILIGYLIVNIELVVDVDLQAGAVEDVKRFWEERKFESGSRGKKNATTPSLRNAVLSGLR